MYLWSNLQSNRDLEEEFLVSDLMKALNLESTLFYNMQSCEKAEGRRFEEVVGGEFQTIYLLDVKF